MAANSINGESGRTTHPDEIKWSISPRRRKLSVQREDNKRKRTDADTAEICQWLKQVLGIEIEQETFMDKLSTGEDLCKLQNIVVSLQGNKPIKFREDAQRNQTIARENIQKFIRWCEGFIDSSLLFESNDLVDRKNDPNCRRRVVLCLDEVKQTYDRLLYHKREAKASKSEESEEIIETVVDKTDSSTPTSKTKVTGIPDHSDLHVIKQFSNLPPVQEDDDEPKDEDKPKDKDKLQQPKDEVELKEIKHEEESKDKGALKDTEEALSTEDSVFDTNKPSEGEPSTEKNRDTSASEPTISLNTSEIKSRHISKNKSSLGEQKNKKISDDSHPNSNIIYKYMNFYPLVFLCLIAIVILGGLYFLKF